MRLHNETVFLLERVPSGEAIYIFKIFNGPDPSDIFYGMFKAASIVPGTSITYEYKIGNTYSQLSVVH